MLHLRQSTILETTFAHICWFHFQLISTIFYNQLHAYLHPVLEEIDAMFVIIQGTEDFPPVLGLSLQFQLWLLFLYLLCWCLWFRNFFILTSERMNTHCILNCLVIMQRTCLIGYTTVTLLQTVKLWENIPTRECNFEIRLR